MILYLAVNERIDWSMSAPTSWSVFQVRKHRKEKKIRACELRATVRNLRFTTAAITRNKDATSK